MSETPDCLFGRKPREDLDLVIRLKRRHGAVDTHPPVQDELGGSPSKISSRPDDAGDDRLQTDLLLNLANCSRLPRFTGLALPFRQAPLAPVTLAIDDGDANLPRVMKLDNAASTFDHPGT